MKVLFRTTALLALTALAANAQTIVGRNESTWSTRERLSSGDRLKIVSPNGGITITQGSGSEVEIRAEKRADRDARMDDIGFVVRRTDDGLVVCAVYEDADECQPDGSRRSYNRRNWNERRNYASASFTVRIPQGVLVSASSGNGDIAINDAGSDVNASTGNGRVLVSGTTGRVRASTGNGRVTVEGASGPVNASTGNGDVSVSTSSGPVSASSGNGDIEVSMSRMSRAAEMRFSTGSGRIVLGVPEGFGADLESSTGSGSITSEIPIRIEGRASRYRLRGQLGDGGERLAMSTGSGDILIRRSR
ncbi:MAG TPA: DUF4097 family beta strand repeat-containing protein [Gemmatimonadaceae bacterium]|nr:DUF4097 family beta strand repeat-containing protein [Gemmatimonadaceae bacterium]